MNIETYRKCFDICDVVRAARASKEIRMRDYPTAIVTWADSWQNYSILVTEKQMLFRTERLLFSNRLF